jgi:hypothetical protein
MRHRLESVRVTVQCHFCQSTNVIVSDGSAEAKPVNCSTCGALGPLGVLLHPERDATRWRPTPAPERRWNRRHSQKLTNR